MRTEARANAQFVLNVVPGCGLHAHQHPRRHEPTAGSRTDHRSLPPPWQPDQTQVLQACRRSNPYRPEAFVTSRKRRQNEPSASAPDSAPVTVRDQVPALTRPIADSGRLPGIWLDLGAYIYAFAPARADCRQVAVMTLIAAKRTTAR